VGQGTGDLRRIRIRPVGGAPQAQLLADQRCQKTDDPAPVTSTVGGSQNALTDHAHLLHAFVTTVGSSSTPSMRTMGRPDHVSGSIRRSDANPSIS
jgi:hypothetical protein